MFFNVKKTLNKTLWIYNHYYKKRQIIYFYTNVNIKKNEYNLNKLFFNNLNINKNICKKKDEFYHFKSTSFFIEEC